MAILVALLCLFLFPVLAHSQQPPPIPAWPDQFNIKFYVYVEEYGDNWKSDGALFYDWTTKTFRADYYDWCLPLFDSGPGEFNNYTCSFLATDGNMYFVNHTSNTGEWKDNECCLFEGGLAATSPDWMKNDQYNGTDNIRGFEVDVWWFPGTNDPSKPCYGYWNIRDKVNTPVRFFGLSSIGPTILDYFDYKPEDLPSNIDISKPRTGCDKECEPPLLNMFKKTKGNGAGSAYPAALNWPSCE